MLLVVLEIFEDVECLEVVLLGVGVFAEVAGTNDCVAGGGKYKVGAAVDGLS